MFNKTAGRRIIWYWSAGLTGMLFCLCGFAAHGQQALKTLLVGADRRNAISLDGEWHFIVDQAGRGLYDASGRVRDDGYALNRHPVLTGERHGFDEYDFATAPVLKVPGDWNTQVPDLFRYEGVVWYERDFSYQPRPTMRTFLHVGAANYRSYVWVNGKRICDHEGGFTPFDCEVTAAVSAGKNAVVIAVDATRLADGIPGLEVDWFNYGGLTRDVSLIEVPRMFIDDYDVHLKPGTRDVLAGYIHVESAPKGTLAKVTIPEAGIQATVATDEQGRASFEQQAPSLQLWSPGQPRLYKVELSSGEDSIPEEIGFRDIQVLGTEILLNGKPIFLKGVNAHAEAPYRTGRVSTQADVDAIFSFLKDLNANFVRLCHYPHDERMTRTADRDGVMVWSEIPIWQHISFDQPSVYAKAEAMLDEMIRRDRNKASVILWSMANETPDNAVRTEFIKKLITHTHALDETRPVTAALLQPHFTATDNTLKLVDPLAEALDVVGVNEYVGWYYKLPEQADGVAFELPQKPIIISEFGAEAKQGNHGPLDQRWTEESQVNFYKHNLVMLSKIPQVRGFAPWVLMDFRSPTRNIPLLQDGFNRKGLIAEDGKKKQAFFLLQKIYKEGTANKAE